MKLALTDIYKSFGAGNVLDGVSLSVGDGEICALLGENGAGKSTLMNVVGGVFSADRGDILIDGKKRVFLSPSDSMKAGIAFIHQELNLVNDLTVYENLFLSGFRKKGIVLDKREMLKQSAELFEKFGINVDPAMTVSGLDASYKQMVAIARALSEDASLIIMDEPTTSLTPAETGRLFDIMRGLKEKGITVIFISHKLREVMEICDTFAVLRNGKLVSSGKIADTDVKRLAADMVGHEISAEQIRAVPEYGEEALKITNLSDAKNFSGMSLRVRRGEILGVTGLLGDGRSELFETVFGIHGGAYSGKIAVNGKEVHPSSPHAALKAGLAYLPKNRKENAVVADLPILDNGTLVTLSDYCRALTLNAGRQKKAFLRQKTRLNIKMSDEMAPITSLSGGNQQKTIFARWLLGEPAVLILDNPTQGVDVGAKEEIYSIIGELADNGMAIVVLSAEAQEIIRLCEKCVVMYHGKAVAEISGDEMTEQNIMRLATGAGEEEKRQ